MAQDDAARGRLRGRLTAWLSSLRREREVSPNTLASYKTAWRLLVGFGVEQRGLPESGDWRLSQVDREFVQDFLQHLERGRGWVASTRNQRLAAVKSFYHWLRTFDPGMREHCDRILGIPDKRTAQPVIDYLEQHELRAVFRSVDTSVPEGMRNLAMLALAYNTAARVHELAHFRIDWIRFGDEPVVRVWGKGRKERELPLWSGAAELLRTYLAAHRRPPANATCKPYLFLNRRGQRMTRWGVASVLEQAMARAASHCPSMASKHLTAHGMRHTTAVHLLQSGVDLVTIQKWLGHASPESVHVYLGLDLKSRRDLLDNCLKLDELLADTPDDDWLSPL